MADISQLGYMMDGARMVQRDGGGKGDSGVIDPEDGSDHNREVAHLCLVGEGLEITCE